MTPELFNDNPGGSELPPPKDHTMAGDAPKALRVVLYEVPTDPPGKKLVPTASTRNENAKLAEPVPASWAVTRGENVPPFTGTPDNTPVALLMLSPSMDGGFRLHEYGGTPPVARIVVAYEIPATAPGTEVVVMETGFGRIVSGNDADAEAPTMSVTTTSTLNVPAEGGIPVSWPVDWLMLSQAGAVCPKDHMKLGGTPPVLVSVVE
jgi:hypothetical protein